MSVISQIPLKNKSFDNWNWKLCPNNPYVSIIDADRRTALLSPFQDMYVGVQGTKALNGCRAYWETEMKGTDDDKSFISGIASIVGDDDLSWFRSGYGLTFHGNISDYYSNESNTLGVFFDGIAGTMTYYADGKCLGVGFTGLHKIKEPLFPMVCCSLRPMTITLKHTYSEILNLRELCILKVSSRLTNKEEAYELEMPKTLADDIAKRVEEVND